MLARDLIKLLEEKIREHEPHIEVMGELDIVIDKFKKIEGTHEFHYAGFDREITLDFDVTGYTILNGFVEERVDKLGS